ncbi:MULTISPECIES: hypothetical protein [Microbacterium]|uniref:Glutaminase n=1 Tax=Microbacterium saccharophilum TaxID=1213358 RepID=A0A7Z7D0B6_9MICO|nr:MULTISPECIES: hypothetical protein [Microbacterium]SFI57993.1 hypothetical protein SAMN04487751_2220 [Microbacterium saccharophilum]
MTDATASTLLATARERLRGAPQERLGEAVAPRRVFGLGRAARVVPVHEAWHVGVLLLSDDAAFATGEILRAQSEAIRGFTAESQRARAELAAAARRGGFGEGEVVHLAWQPLDIPLVDRGGTSGPLSVVGGVVHVRWSAAGGTRPLADYLAEQLSLR